MNNAQTNDKFLLACKNVGLPPTKRQRRKWNNKTGLAYKLRNEDINGDKFLALALSNIGARVAKEQ